MRGITTFFTSLTSGGEDLEQSEVGISSLVDTWLLLQIVRGGGERNRTVAIIKSRGMPHSTQAVEYRLSDRGFEIVDTYLGTAGVLTGLARLAREAEDAAAMAAGSEEIARKEQARERRRRALEWQIAELREQFEAEDAALRQDIQEAVRRGERLNATRGAMAQSRQAFALGGRTGQQSSKEGRR